MFGATPGWVGQRGTIMTREGFITEQSAHFALKMIVEGVVELDADAKSITVAAVKLATALAEELQLPTRAAVQEMLQKQQEEHEAIMRKHFPNQFIGDEGDDSHLNDGSISPIRRRPQ